MYLRINCKSNKKEFKLEQFMDTRKIYTTVNCQKLFFLKSLGAISTILCSSAFWAIHYYLKSIQCGTTYKVTGKIVLINQKKWYSLKTIKQGTEFITIYLTKITKFIPIYLTKVKESRGVIRLGYDCSGYY